jgi:hypothetical protein
VDKQAALWCEKCDTKTGHKFLKEKGDYNEIYEVACVNCNIKQDVLRKKWLLETTFMDAFGSRKAHLTKYPRIEACSGEIVKSKQHEHELMRHKGYKTHEEVLRNKERGRYESK